MNGSWRRGRSRDEIDFEDEQVDLVVLTGVMFKSSAVSSKIYQFDCLSSVIIGHCQVTIGSLSLYSIFINPTLLQQRKHLYPRHRRLDLKVLSFYF